MTDAAAMLSVAEGVELNVREEGWGEPVVLLHGHTLDLRVWDGIVPVLLDAGLRAIRYDQRGHGRSASPPSGYRWGDHAADLAAVIERFAAAPTHVVGLSKGGGIALELALRRCELVRSLSLVGPLVPDFPLSPELLASLKELARRIRTDGIRRAMREFWLAHPLMAPAYAIPDVRKRLEAMVLSFPAGEYFARTRDAADREWRVVDRLGKVAVPTMVVVGEGDIPDFVAMATLLSQRVAGSILEVVEGSGHLVPLERPRECGELLRRFLAADTAARL